VTITGTEFTAFIKRAEFAATCRSAPERFSVGQKVDAASPSSIAAPQGRGIIKALGNGRRKEAIAQYGSSDSGATLGDILGTALKQRATTRTKE